MELTITSMGQLRITKQRIARLERSIVSARKRLAGDPDLLDPLLALHLKHLEELQQEVREYLGLGRPSAGGGRGKTRR